MYITLNVRSDLKSFIFTLYFYELKILIDFIETLNI